MSNFSFRGKKINISPDVASGFFSINEHLNEIQTGNWPSQFDLLVTNLQTNSSFFHTFSLQGDLIFKDAGEYSLLALSNRTKNVKMWGGGAGGNHSASNSQGFAWGVGGGGGAAFGTINFSGSTPFILRVPSFGTQNTTPQFAWGAGAGNAVYSVGKSGSGGGYAGIFLGSVSQQNALLMAGGGGGGASARSDGLGGRSGTAGGGSSGHQPGDLNAAPGTQSAGGAAAGGSSPTSGSALQGGNGAGGGGGGGGGYFGGGGGGTHGDGGYGGGGGSGFGANNSPHVISFTLLAGVFGYSGANTDPDIPLNVLADDGSTGRAGRGGAIQAPNINLQRATGGAIVIKA